MFFRVLPHRVFPPDGSRARAFLVTDNWDDWFAYNTMYFLVVYDAEGNAFRPGGVKIGQFNMLPDQRRADIPRDFEDLGPEFFSLGQDDSYYEALNQLGHELRDRVLRGLRDVALDQDRFQRALGEKVTGVSLLRSVRRATVQGQFARLARGGARLSHYQFEYTAPSRSRAKP